MLSVEPKAYCDGMYSSAVHWQIRKYQPGTVYNKFNHTSIYSELHTMNNK